VDVDFGLLGGRVRVLEAGMVCQKPHAGFELQGTGDASRPVRPTDAGGVAQASQETCGRGRLGCSGKASHDGKMTAVGETAWEYAVQVKVDAKDWRGAAELLARLEGLLGADEIGPPPVTEEDRELVGVGAEASGQEGGR
jgi:hypothetical protein